MITSHIELNQDGTIEFPYPTLPAIPWSEFEPDYHKRITMITHDTHEHLREMERIDSARR